MRLAQLDLTRYGRFSDYSLEFGAAPPGGSDFHIVYGLNESGKSTAAAAILDLLFGIEKQSAYGVAKGRATVPNWHSYNTMRIGARLEIGDRSYDVARLKRDKNSLVDADNRPLDEGLVKAELAGADREAFHLMFSLDDKSLEDGGEAILSSRGDLGQLLFSASAGLAEIGSRLEALREGADAFHRPRASTSELARMKHELGELHDRRKDADTLASSYAELIRQRDKTKEDFEAAAKALSKRRAREDEIQRMLAALPHLAALREAEGHLAPLAGLPTPPEGWGKTLASLQDEAIRLGGQKEIAESAIRTLQGEVEEIADDTPALEVAGRVGAWRELRSRYDVAKDIPVRQGELSGKRGDVQGVLRRLGREDEAEASRLLLRVETVGALEDLIAARSGVVSRLETAGEALNDAKGAHARAHEEASRSAIDRKVASIEALKRRLQAARRGDSAGRARALSTEVQTRERKLAEALADLLPWRGDVEALALVSIPGEAETAELRRRLSQAGAARQQHFSALSALTGDAERLKAEAMAAARAPDLLTDDEAAGIRSTREAAWSAHRASLDRPSADLFEAVMRRDDAAAAARLASARELATLRERTIKIAGLETDCARAKADLEAADQAIAALDREIAALAPAPSPAGRDPLSFIDAWRVRREEALALAVALRETMAEAGRTGEDDAGARSALSAALRDAGVAHDADGALEALIEAAETAIGEEAKLEGLRKTANERQADLARAEGKLKSAVEADTAWREAWRQARAGSWLGENEGEPSLGAARQTIKALDELSAALKDCAELEHRIAAMESDRRFFAAEVASIAAALGFEDHRDDAARCADAIGERVAEACENRRRRDEKTSALAAARKQVDGINQALAVNARLGAAMTDLFAVETLAEVAAKLEACKRRDGLCDEIATETRAILNANVANTLDAARAALERADAAALAGELAELKARAADDDLAHAEAHTAFREAVRRLDAVGGDDAVARIEERRSTILEEVKEGALRYLRVRAGVAAADEALRLYRERHRGAMMERASKAFSLISRGAYKGLTAQPNGRSETLIALGGDGGSKEADQLSKGARFQLYLALRVAGYHELARARVPAPFVADDIMETFDHFRAEEALRLFAQMGRVGQVIYFTHHQHLAEIARRVCPEAKVHELIG